MEIELISFHLAGSRRGRLTQYRDEPRASARSREFGEPESEGAMGEVVVSGYGRAERGIAVATGCEFFLPCKALKSHKMRKESRETGTVHARRSSRSAGVTKRTRRAAWGVTFAQCSVEKSSTASPQVGKAPAMRVLSSFGPAAVS